MPVLQTVYQTVCVCFIFPSVLCTDCIVVVLNSDRVGLQHRLPYSWWHLRRVHSTDVADCDDAAEDLENTATRVWCTFTGREKEWGYVGVFMTLRRSWPNPLVFSWWVERAQVRGEM